MERFSKHNYRPRAHWIVLICIAFTAPGCSIKRIATTAFADSLADSGTLYASDDDIDLVGAAIPFGLKIIEGLLAEVPEHRGLLVAAASGFTQYAYAYVAMPADEIEDAAPKRARKERRRAKRLYLRARDYALRALELAQPGFRARLARQPAKALAAVGAEQVPELYWATVSWAAAIAADKQDMELMADLRLIEPMMRRCLELDETFNHGGGHEFMIAFQGGRHEAQGGSIKDARRHYARAMELARGRSISPMVGLAENVSVRINDRKEFEDLLQRVLGFDVDTQPAFRLANLIAQRRAQFLLARIDDLFNGDVK